MRSTLLLAVLVVYICNVFGQEEIFPFICAEYDGATTNTSLIDYYDFTLTQTTTIKIDSCGSSYDTYLYFEETDGTVIAECDDCGGCGSRTILDVEKVPAGEYRIGVGGFDTEFGTYTVDVTCTPPVPKNCSNGPFETVSFSNTISVSTDDVGATIFDTITVSGISDRVYLVDVSVEAETTWVGDVLIQLIYNGQEITLISYEGMDGDNIDVTISDTAIEECEDKYFNNTGDDPRINGECNPDDTLRLLLGNGSDINGNWTIEIFDLCDSCEPTNFGTWTLTFYTCPETATPAPTECEKGFDYIGTNDHVVDARAACEARGQTLATLRDENDIALFRTYWEAEGLPYTGDWDGDGNAAIGLTDLDKEGVFKWDDGTSCETGDDLCIDYWSVDEPNDNNGEDCATFAFPSSTDGTQTYANDIWCDRDYVPWPNGLYTFCNVPCEDDCDQYIYVDTPMSFDDAQAYCESEYGTSLAGVNRDDRPQANCAITDPGEPTWIGLYSRRRPAFFKFISGERCDRPRTGACVNFWGTMDKGIRAPKCLKRGGFPCGYYRESSQLVYNNLDCETKAAFLCEKYPVSYSASIGLLEEIKDYIDEGINGDNVDNKNKFYLTIVTTFAGFILIITLIFECIYCLCKCKKKEKVSYDKVGNEIEKVEESEEEESEEEESEDKGVMEQDI